LKGSNAHMGSGEGDGCVGWVAAGGLCTHTHTHTHTHKHVERKRKKKQHTQILHNCTRAHESEEKL
jgi:hypothetical protein